MYLKITLTQHKNNFNIRFLWIFHYECYVYCCLELVYHKHLAEGISNG